MSTETYPGFESGLILIRIRMSAGSLSKCFGHIALPASVISPSFVRTPLSRKHVVCAIERKNQCNGSIWARERGKKDNKKVTKVLYLSCLGVAPTVPIRPKSCMLGDVHDVVTCAEFQIENFNGLGLRFYSRVEFSIFPFDFCMGFTTVQR